MIAHAIYCQMAFLRGSIHHIASRTHTERINTPAGTGLPGQLIAGRPETSRLFPSVLGQINQRLRVLNPQTHGKGLGIHGDLLFLQHRKGIPALWPTARITA